MTKAISSLCALAITLGASSALAESEAPPPPTPPPAVEPAPAATGQWVHTAQHGWIWVPYARSFTYVSGDGSLAYEYVYYPAFGWRWVSAPWVLGLGPTPLWGVHGYGRFAWHAHPWFGRHHDQGHAGYHARATMRVGASGFHRAGRGRR